MKRKLKPVEVVAPLKLDLGCGKNKRPGFIGVDTISFDGVDIICDLGAKSWVVQKEADLKCKNPGLFATNNGDEVGEAYIFMQESVNEVHCSHFLEHLTQSERVHFFNELFRVMQFGAQANIIIPSWSSERAYGDPTHKWPPVVGFSFYYLCKSWRDANAPHTGYTCDFDFQGGNNLAHPWQLKNQEAQMFAQNHYLNVATDTFVTVTKTKRG